MSFLVLGEALVDLVAEAEGWRFEAVPGGSPLNVAVALAATGQPVRLASRVGGDMFGELIRDHLTRHRVDLRDLRVGPEPTSLAVARLDPAGVARYQFYGGTDWVGPVALTGVSWLHVGSLAALREPAATAVRAAVADAGRRGVPVSYDPNLRPALLGTPDQTRPAVERLVAAATVVKASREDLAWLYPGTPPAEVARRWAARGPRLVIVTDGAAGAVAVTGDERLACPAPTVAVVDTIGAGDGFTAGLLDALTRDDALARDTGVADALRWAVASGTACCLRRGAGPADPATVSSLAAALPPPRRQPSDASPTDGSAS